MKRALSLYFIWCVLLMAVSCGGLISELYTDLFFDPEKTVMLGDSYIACAKDGELDIYSVERKRGVIKPYWHGGSEQVCDWLPKRDLALLSSGGQLAVLDIKKKKTAELTKAVFTKDDLAAELNAQSFFIESGNTLAVIKVIRDKEKPIMLNGALLGWELSSDSGVYLYSLANMDTPSLLHAVKIDDFGVFYNPTDSLSFKTKELDSGKLAVVAETKPLGTAFANQYFFTLDVQTGSSQKIGEYLLKENVDRFLETAFIKNSFIAVNTRKIICVDFLENRMREAKPEETAENAEGADLLLCEASGYFVTRFYTQASEWYQKYELTGVEIQFSDFKKENLAQVTLVKNAGANVSSLLLPEETVKKYTALKEGTVVYRSFSDSIYLAEADKKAVLLFK